MANVVIRRIVPGSQELVWHLVSDLDRLGEWMPDIASVEHLEGPRRALGRQQKSILNDGSELHQRVVNWDDSRRLAWRVERHLVDGIEVSDFHNVRTTIDLRPVGSDTELTVTSTWSTGNPVAWLRSFSEKGRVRQRFEAALEAIDSMMRAGAQPPTSP